jgi:hypothetical protein
VAGFVTALKDIDGVTRVGVQNSELGTGEAGAGIGGGSSSGDCRTRRFIAKFDMVVVFDAAPVPLGVSGEEAAPVTTSAGAGAASEEASESTSESASENAGEEG